MTIISKFDSEDFLNYLLDKIPTQQKENTNLQYTHNRVSYNPETGELSYEEICKNSDGQVFGRGVFGYAIIPKEWSVFLPSQLQQSPNWMDV